MKTTVELKGNVAGKTHFCLIVRDSGPEEIFGNKTASEVFYQNTGLQPEEVAVNIRVEREFPFGGTRFETNNIQEALEEAKRLQKMTEKEAMEEIWGSLPTPEDLFDFAVESIIEGNEKKAFAIAETFETVGKMIIGPEAKGCGEGMLIAAAFVAEEVKKRRNLD